MSASGNLRDNVTMLVHEGSMVALQFTLVIVSLQSVTKNVHEQVNIFNSKGYSVIQSLFLFSKNIPRYNPQLADEKIFRKLSLRNVKVIKYFVFILKSVFRAEMLF